MPEKDLLFHISATLTSKAAYDIDGELLSYDKKVISELLTKIEKVL